VKTTFAFILAILAFQGEASRTVAGDAFVPLNPPEMQPLTNRESPAYRAARLFRHGVNLGNYLEVPPDENWGVTFSADEFALMRAEGFDHVRVPVGWPFYTSPGPNFTLSPEIFRRVDFVVTNALANHLAVIINVHNFSDFIREPDRRTSFWRSGGRSRRIMRSSRTRSPSNC
jgi:endoglucanase